MSPCTVSNVSLSEAPCMPALRGTQRYKATRSKLYARDVCLLYPVQVAHGCRMGSLREDQALRVPFRNATADVLKDGHQHGAKEVASTAAAECRARACHECGRFLSALSGQLAKISE